MADNGPDAAAYKPLFRRYGGAILAVVAASFLRWLLHDYCGVGVIFITYFPTVALVAMFAGSGPGILATILSSFIVAVWFDFGLTSSGEAVSLGLFIAAGLIVSSAAEMLRRPQQHEANLIGERLVEQELELAEQDERYRLLAEHAEDFVSLSDDEGNLLYVSPSYYRRTGWTPTELRSSNWRTRGHPDDLGLIELTREANLARQTTTIEYRMRCRDDSWVWVEGRCKPVTDAAGKVRRMVLWAREITERKKAEQALRESEARQRLVLQASAIGTFEVNLVSGETDWNNVEFELLGLHPGEAPAGAATFFRFVHPDDVDRVRGQWEEAQRTGVFDSEFRIMRADGRERWLAGKGRFVEEANANGRSSRFMGVNFDISERKELQKQVLEISVNEQRRIGQELHDGTRQELTGLALVAGTLLDILNAAPTQRTDDESVWVFDQSSYKQLCDISMKLSQRLAETNRHVWQLAHGIMPVQIDSEGLRSALNELAASTNELNQISCQFDCSSQISVANNTTATHLFRIAQEAVNNALRHGRANQIQISLKQPDGHLILEVHDIGVGFDPAALPRNPSDSETHGMGLRIMEYRAGMIGGTLHVERSATGGTSVKCVFIATDNRSSASSGAT